MTEKASGPERGLYRISLWLSVVSAIALCLMMVVTVIDVGGRYCFNKPIYGSYELIGMLLVAASTLGMAACQKEKSHITVSLVVDLLPARARSILVSLALFFSFATFSIITWRMAVLTVQFYARGRGGVSPDLGISNGHVSLVFSIGALMFSLVLLLHLLQALRNAIRRS
ncbi:MAG: TRAP transporter small permease [Deltaproteobacteria bacterium]|nr:TRAP transporter small permease [Deltaproteobacteria bacterium]